MPARRKYEWDELFARRRFALRRGIDYTCSNPSMAQQIRNAASARGLSVHVGETRTGLKVDLDPATTKT